MWPRGVWDLLRAVDSLYSPQTHRYLENYWTFGSILLGIGLHLYFNEYNYISYKFEVERHRGNSIKAKSKSTGEKNLCFTKMITPHPQDRTIIHPNMDSTFSHHGASHFRISTPAKWSVDNLTSNFSDGFPSKLYVSSPPLQGIYIWIFLAH